MESNRINEILDLSRMSSKEGHLITSRVFGILICWTLRAVATSSHQKIIDTLLAKPYDSDAMPLDRSNAVLVSYGAKLVRIIDLKERENTIRSQWWIYQLWLNPDLTWKQADYNNTNIIHVSPRRIWAPDIILYNSAANDDKLGGGTEKYKTKIAVNSSGYCTWMAPAIFQSTCDINTEYFPFDDQECTLKFGSWAFDGSELDITIQESETGVKEDIYQNNTEWEMLNVTVTREEFKYSCCHHPYPTVILKLHLRRRYHFYMVNLVIPCSLIALMVLLSFILPPESGERIGLGITVLMAMAIFQELTSNKLPADSRFVPLLAKYYSTAIAEIGLALFATCVILNFYYREETMPNWLKTLMFRVLGPMVRIKYKYKLSHKVKKKHRNQSLLDDNFELSELTGNPFPESGKVEKKRSIHETHREENGLGSCHEVDTRLSTQCTRSRTQSTLRETPIVNDHLDGCTFDESLGAQMTNNIKDWQTATKILDRVVLILGILITIITFLSIFLQAPRVREIFFV